MTGELNAQAMKQLKNYGVRYFLRKPIQPEVLSLTLTQLLKKKDRPKKKQAIQIHYLRKITSGNRQLMAEIIDVFIEEAPANFHTMKTYCLLKDWYGLKAILHKIGSNYKYVGLEVIETMLRDFEVDLERLKETESYLARIIDLEERTAEAIEGLKKKKELLIGKRSE